MSRWHPATGIFYSRKVDNMKTNGLLLIFFILPVSIFAQTSWNLKACIDFGLKNNRNRVIYLNQKKAADAKAKEALAAYLPSVSLSTTLDDNIKAQEVVIPAGLLSPTDIKVTLTKQYNTGATAQLDQTIFDQSLLVGLKARKYNEQQADLNIEQSEETIIYNVATAYYQILVYREQLSLLKADQETYRRQMELLGLQVAKGTKLQRDLDKLKVDYNNTVSRIRGSETDITLSENQLKFEMGYPINSGLTVDSIDITQTPGYADSSLANGKSYASRVDYRMAQINVQLYQIEQRRIKAGIYPKLTAYAKYGAVGFGDNISQSYGTLYPLSVVGFKLNIPVFDFYKRNAQYKQAQINTMNAQETLQLDEEKYRLEYENARAKLLKEQTNMEENRRNIDLARSVFEVTNLQYQKGTTDLTDWINAQNSIKEAQSNYLNSLYNFLLSRVDLEKANGTLKNFYHTL